MTPQELLFDLVVRAIVLSMPIAVGVLAFRRLLMSQTSNAWLYALAVGCSAFATMGLMPWALGLQAVSVTFVLLAVICPPVWMLIIYVCGLGRPARYDFDDDDLAARATVPLHPLVLANPIVEEPVVVFRHQRREAELSKVKGPSVVSVARSMRGRETSEDRRVRKLLPPPSSDVPDLPFLR